jgi:hypothetical protein
MYPTISQEPAGVGKVSNEQRQLQQAQLQMQQMAQQMAQMQQQLLDNQRPVSRTYTFDQIQIILSCETIKHVLAEFDLSEPKAVRLQMARDYLYHLGDLREFLPQSQQQQQQPQYSEEEDLDDNAFRDDTSDLAGGETDDGELPPERTSSEDIDEINKKMASLKSEEAARTVEKGKSGIEKIKDFISKKNNPEKLDSSNQSESMG